MSLKTKAEVPNVTTSEAVYPIASDPSAYPIDHDEERLLKEEEELGVNAVWLDKRQVAQVGPNTKRSDEPVSGRTGIDCGGEPSVTNVYHYHLPSAITKANGLHDTDFRISLLPLGYVFGTSPAARCTVGCEIDIVHRIA